MDQSAHDSLTGMAFDEYGSFHPASTFSTLPNSYFDTQALLAGAPADVMAGAYLKAPTYNNSNTEHPPPTLSSTSAPSIPSATSSTVGSPYSGPIHTIHYQDAYSSSQSLGLDPTILTGENFGYDFGTTDFESDLKFNMHHKADADSVDPSLIQSPQMPTVSQAMFYPAEQMYTHMHNPAISSYTPIASPAPSQSAVPASMFPGSQFGPGQSPQLTYNTFDPASVIRPASVASEHSYHSHQSPLSGSFDGEEDGRQRGRCPHPDCGKVFKDLKAHMLTHQSERPEKCPIVTCEYNQKGFARKYDKNRHTLTHYKGTMVCGFCPGSGSAAEKSFNRADVFKRHLTSVHGVEQTPPNSRKRSPGSNKKLSSYCQDATGKCSTCSATFNNAQDFYEHLDDCVLRVVQQEEPSEAINHQHLTDISVDDAVKDTLERHMLTQTDSFISIEQEDADDAEEDEDEDDEDSLKNPRSGKGHIKAQKSGAPSSRVVLGTNSAINKKSGVVRKGLTFSKGGVSLVGKGRKKRKHYPTSWGMSLDKMKMKKRVLCVYDGPRRLWKDDMMLDNEFEVRMKLADGKSYVTDLDVETLKRAEAIHGATEAEKGPWIPEQDQTFNINELMA
ncbi:putative c2h2 finger domain-containing protein [Phaeomoniella chlamydospora]|uniref:Putative c2h2 finger domain-containing protein n=1 Tax=Phaeomoniella chlamydospora TaxID=158046 RepID=A0A0G2FW99_PHACM|nr:putative c2h2 finger domain-containing protein [Phaeomoniella chlamydospora]